MRLRLGRQSALFSAALVLSACQGTAISGGTNAGKLASSSTGAASSTGSSSSGSIGSAGTASSSGTATGGGTSTGANTSSGTSSGSSSGGTTSGGDAGPLFLAQVPYSIRGYATGIVARMTYDGGVDLVVADPQEGSLVLLQGQGDGTFVSHGGAGLSEFIPYSLCSADFNQDGIGDVAALQASSGSAAVYLATGADTFAGAPLSYPGAGLTSYVRDVVAGDWNGDGNPDLAIVDGVTTWLNTSLGDGGGGFGEFTSYDAGATCFGLIAADLDGKNGPDFAVLNGTNSAALFFNDGSGGFAFGSELSTPAGPVAIAAGNFDGKNGTDLAIAGNGIAIFLNDGGGGFTEQSTTYEPGVTLSAIVAADFDFDGKLDLAVACSAGVYVLLGNGDGTFQGAMLFAVADKPVALVVADFNRDGRPDLATLNQGSGSYSVSVLVNGR